MGCVVWAPARCPVTVRVRREPWPEPTTGAVGRSGRAVTGWSLVDTEERAAFTASAEHWMVRGGGLDIEVVPPGTLRTE